MTALQAMLPALQRTPVWGGWRVWQRNRDAVLRAWKVEFGGVLVEPFILLFAMGFGLGPYIGNMGDLTYAEFIAPGVLASYAMFHATFDATYGAYLRMESHHIYEAMLFTPMEPRDIVLGEVMWGATRSIISASAVLVTATAFRACHISVGPARNPGRLPDRADVRLAGHGPHRHRNDHRSDE